ncbi:MAG: HNH endonuclease [Cyanothece sp. SIO2G6]|nr:HNH endonuclease [Cyanothece sp. SIO2G6]
MLPKKKTPRIAIPKSVRDYVLKRDRHTCRHCGSQQNLSVDHIKPISKGGSNDMSNFQTLCRRCNSRKGDRISPKQSKFLRT